MSGESGLVVLVTGATRGLGQGMARAFGSKGAKVYITGRDAAGLSAVVAQIEAAGGKGIGLLCDHREDEQVAAALQRIEDDAGKLDILVNNAAAVHPDALMAPGGFWEVPLKLVDMIDVGLRSSYVAAFYAAPMMVKAGRGLIANISFYGASSYFHGPAYGAAKAGTDKMSFDMALDLAPHGVAAIALWPGFILTDAVKAIPPEHFPAEMRAHLPLWEHPEFCGLVLEALYRDAGLSALSGQALIAAELGQRYGIVDLDGKQPVSYRDSMGAPLAFFRPSR